MSFLSIIGCHLLHMIRSPVVPLFLTPFVIDVNLFIGVACSGEESKKSSKLNCAQLEFPLSLPPSSFYPPDGLLIGQIEFNCPTSCSGRSRVFSSFQLSPLRIIQVSENQEQTTFSHSLLA